MYDSFLQQYLRQFSPLSEVDVGYKSELSSQLEPYLVTISGQVSLYGELRGFEADVDMREIESEADVLRLAGMLIKSFERAAEQVKLH